MEGGGNRWTNAQGDPGEESSIEWRSHLHPEARQRIVNKIMDTLKRHLPINGAEGISELNKIAVRFEEKIYTAATSQSDYLRKISMKMLTMEQKTQNGVTANPISSGSSIPSQGTADSASLMQPQVRNQGLPMQVPLANQPQARQQLLGPNLQNNVTSTTVQGTGSLSPALSSLTGLTQPNITTFGQNQNMHVMPTIGQNSVNNTSGQNVPASMYTNSQRQIQGRSYQQPIMSQQHQQQPQNQLLYQQQLLKQKLQQTSQMQSQIPQQQNPTMQVNQLQTSQQPLVQMSSSHQSNQNSLQHSQSTMIQSVSQNQQSPIQQPASSLHQQSTVRQQQQSHQPNLHQQASSHVQQPSSITQQSAVLPPQQQQNIGHPSNMSSVQQNQLLVQQNNISDLQLQIHQQQSHQRLTNQQNGLMSIQQQQQMINQQNSSLHQQQQMPPQNNISNLQQQQSLQVQQHQSQMLGSQTAVSAMQHQHPVHIMQHSRAASQQVQQTSQSPLQLQSQQIQAQSSQHQHAPQLQPQSHLQQPMGMQQMHQRLQASVALLQPQNAVELQKQQFQSQRVLPEAPSTSVDSTAQTGQAGVDWQEEVYQKIKSLKEMYSADLQDMSQRIGSKLQQDSLALPSKQSEQFEGMKKLKSVIERMLQLLHFPKSSIQPELKNKLSVYEKQIIHILATRGRRVGPSQLQGQQQLQQSGTQNLPMPQPPSQVSHQQQADSQLNQMQQVTFQATSAPMHSTAMPTMQIGSMPLPTQSGVPNTQVNMLISTQSGSNPESGNASSSMQQGPISSLQAGGLGSLQQSSINLAHQNNVNTLMQNNLNPMQHSINSLQANSSVLQPQIKQEQQHQAQQMAMQKRMPQQLIQQRLQQQPQLRQQLQQQKQQPNSQLPVNQMQLQQMNEMNELRAKQISSSKSGLFQPHYPSGQRQAYYQQQQQLHKLPTSFPISSPQNLQAPSPQISQQSSPQIDQQALLSSIAKSGTPLQSVNSPFVVPSPSTPLAPSPLQVEQEKPPSNLSSLSNAGNVGNQQSILMSSQTQSLAVGTPGISASPLLAEFSCVEGNETTNLSAMLPGKPTAAERPVERLLKAVRSSPPEVLASSAHDIASVVSMIDRIAGSAPGNGSRAAVGEDLVAMTKCRMQARNFMSQDGAGTKKMKRHTSAMPLNIVFSAGSIQDSLKRSGMETSELESTATSRIKKLKIETNNALMEEIKYVNQQLIDTVVDITDEDVDSISSTAEGEGTVVKFTYCAVALSPSLKSQFASAKVSPVLPVRLLVPANYPHRSPLLLDKIPVESSKESEDLTVKAKSRFGRSLRGLSQPMSLKDMAKTWDVCARTVISEYAQTSGGGTFCSRYGTWQNVAKV